ncbi:hypothetical protein Clacol_003553 [Clathrus columnatus]|uniref:Pheromone receptor n=1 Tax=Clathrus columnatus TaxID=1419009 RepID=A0AAV5A3V1_9AGAM|nr:hypothetical protein Clacol_003553 [Clathrus columnatus]
MGHPIYPTVCFLVIPFVCASLRSHIRSRNIAVVSLILWVAVLAFIRGVNAIVWYGNVDIRLLVWCDITTKIAIGWTIAIPLTMLCLLKHLENIASNRQAVMTAKDKRRHYCVQGHRFDIYEDFGCYPNTYLSVPALILIYIPPFIVSFISMIYAVLALRHFFHRRVIFSSILKSSNSTLSQTHYFRLMALAIVECLWDTGLNSWVLSLNIKAGLRPWISWENVHVDFSRIDQIPWILIPESQVRNIVIPWWILPISAIGVFFFFAFGAEAKADYLSAWKFIKTKIFRRPDAKRRSIGDLPIDSPLPVTRLSKYLDEKDSKVSKGSTNAPWEKIKLDISQTASFSSSNDGYSPSPLSTTSLVGEKEKIISLSPVKEPARTFQPQRPAPAPALDLGPSRNPTPELRVMGPFEVNTSRPSLVIDDTSSYVASSDSRRGSESKI